MDNRCFVAAEDIRRRRWVQREVTREMADRLVKENTWVDISFCGPFPNAVILPPEEYEAKHG